MYITFTMYLIVISRYVPKSMYLEKRKQTIIWNGGSTIFYSQQWGKRNSFSLIYIYIPNSCVVFVLFVRAFTERVICSQKKKLERVIDGSISQHCHPFLWRAEKMDTGDNRRPIFVYRVAQHVCLIMITLIVACPCSFCW